MVHKGVIMYSFMVVYAANFLMLHYYIFSIHWFMAFPNGFIVRAEKSNMFIFSCIITSEIPQLGNIKKRRGIKIDCVIFVSLKRFYPHITKF